jgi:endonuclease YncB( thermonuclease family)
VLRQAGIGRDEAPAAAGHARAAVPEPATDRVDDYGRLLRYVVRARDNLNVNVQLARLGAAAPYFYEGRRGRHARLLDRLAHIARAHKVGLWRACPHTPYNPDEGMDTRR